MARVYEADRWNQHVMDWHDPHRQIEPIEQEIEVIDGALTALVEAGVLRQSRYDTDKMLAHRVAVRENFDIPWTAITPRMQRLLYAINAIAQPRVMVAVGIFCGNTFISNAGEEFSSMKKQTESMNPVALEGDLEPFLGQPELDMRQLFERERFPNVVVALDGAVLATWGTAHMVIRRSEDSGRTWGPEVTAGEGIHGGGAIVDETTGDVLVFVHPEHPPKDGLLAPRTMYRSQDGGKTWEAEEPAFHEDANGFVPSLHMGEHGIALRHGSHAGRLLRPARVYGRAEGYNTAIYSDDHGRTWHGGEPFPLRGTGEGAVAELSSGRIYYSSRKHFFAGDEPFRHERLYAWSHDGGKRWVDPGYNEVLPDGPRYRGNEGRGACYNGHFGMAAGLTRLPVADKDILIYSNADHSGHERIRMTVWASFDGGRTWPIKRLVYEGASAYSSLIAGRPGTPSEGWIYLQFEEPQAGGRMARFNLSWLVGGERTGDGRLPEGLDH